MSTENVNTIGSNGTYNGDKGRSWAWGITGFYLFFVVTTLSFVTFATSQRTDLVSQDYYQQEIEHQQHIDSVQRTNALPAGMAWTIRKEGDKLLCHFPLELAQEPLTGKIHLYRPSDARQDQQWPIRLDKLGTQRLPTGKLAAGVWTIKIYWSIGTTTYYSEQSLSLN